MAVRDGQIEWPDLEHYSDIPLFNTKAVVQQTGIPAPTLRAWERRYTILSPERADNDYRLYSERDIVMIRWLKNRVESGMSISQAIALLRHMIDEYQQLQENQKPLTGDAPAFYVSLPSTEKTQQETLSVEKDPEEATIATPSPSIEDWPRVDTAYSQGPQSSFLTMHNMQIAREHLLEAFKVLDEPKSTMLMASMLAIHPAEQVCTELITPTMWQIGQLWSEGKINVSVEHFASNFFRGLLSNLFHVTPTPTTGPLVIVCCSPGEPHELAPLMLALFLRRAGIRVAYLGQSIETSGLLQIVKQVAPAILCVSLTMPAYLAGLIDLARQIQELPPPRPIFAYGGQVFSQYAHLVSQIPGMYMSGELKSIVAQLRRITFERPETRN